MAFRCALCSIGHAGDDTTREKHGPATFDDVPLSGNKGNCRAKEHQAGVDVLAAALELPQLQSRPLDFRARYYDRLGFGLLQVDRLEDALQAYQIAQTADPDLAGPKAVLAGFREMAGAAVVA